MDEATSRELAVFLVWSLPLLLSKDFRLIRAFRRREGVRGSRVKNVQTKSWRVVECVDKVSLQAQLSWHPSRSAWEVQASDRRKDWRMVYGLLNVEWRGRQEEQKLGGRE